MRVAVIGHGPSPTGRGWGKKIDACDVVIRMWECGWQSQEDYGERYTYGLFNLAESRDGQRARQHLPCQPVPAKEWWLYRSGGARVPMGLFTKPVRDAPIRKLIAELASLGARTINADKAATPSRGLAAIATAVDRFPAAQIVLVGFDSMTGGRISEREYAPAFQAGLPDWIDWRNDGVRTYAHDFAAECVWISQRPNIVDAREVW